MLGYVFLLCTRQGQQLDDKKGSVKEARRIETSGAIRDNSPETAASNIEL